MTRVYELAHGWRMVVFGPGTGAEFRALERLDREHGVCAFAAIPAFYEASS